MATVSRGPKIISPSRKKSRMYSLVTVLERLFSVGFVYSEHGYENLTELPEVPGTGMEVLQNSQKSPGRYTNAVPVPAPAAAPANFLQGRIRTPGIVPRSYRTRRSSGYTYKCSYIVRNLRELRVRVIPRVWFCTYPTDHNLFLQKFRARVWRSYRIHRSCA